MQLRSRFLRIGRRRTSGAVDPVGLTESGKSWIGLLFVLAVLIALVTAFVASTSVSHNPVKEAVERLRR